MSLFKDKTLMITGGTSPFGNAVLDRFLKTDIGEARIFSCNGKKQDNMRHEFQAEMSEIVDKISFYIGDAQDMQSIKSAMHGIDHIFRAAALKQVPSCELFPIETAKTDVSRAENVLTAAIDDGVEIVICLSTNKAAYPASVMSTPKVMMEKVIVARSRTISKTRIRCTRYRSAMYSHGSVILLWIEQIHKGNTVTLIGPDMAYFIVSLDDVVSLVLFAFEHRERGNILVQKASACTARVQAEAVYDLFGDREEDVKTVGIRHGEKMYETLLTNRKCAHTTDIGNFYRVPCDKRGLNYDRYFIHGDIERNTLAEFNSNNTDPPSVGQVKEKLLGLACIREELQEGSELQSDGAL